MKRLVSRILIAASIGCLPLTGSATVITGNFTGYIGSGDYDRTGSVTGNRGSDMNDGRKVTGRLSLNLNEAPSDSLSNPEQGSYLSGGDWLSIYVDGFHFELPSDTSGYVTQDRVELNSESSTQSLTINDRLLENTSSNAYTYLRQELHLSSLMLSFLSGDSLDQSISWTDGEWGVPDDNYGVFSYQYQWRDDSLGILERATGDVILTDFDLAMPVHAVSEPGAMALLMSGLLGMGFARQRRLTQGKA